MNFYSKNPAIIIDQDDQSEEALANLIQQHCSAIIQLRGCFTNLRDGMKAIQRHKPRLVFLSSLLKGESGFDLLQLSGEKNFEIIVVSNSEQHAFQAYKHEALDYLVKPIDPSSLLRAVGRFARKIPVDSLTRKVEALLGSIEQIKQYTPPKKILVPTLTGFELLPVIDIMRCQSEVNYTTIFLRDHQKLVVAKTLKEFEAILEGYNFFRIHNSHLINLAYVKRYRRGKGGSVVMIDDVELEVSTRRKDDFLATLAGR